MRATQLIVLLGAVGVMVGCAEGSAETYLAAAYGNDKALAQQLFDEGKKFDQTGEDAGGTELWVALEKGNYEIAEVLLDAGANGNGRAGEVPLVEYFQEKKMDEAVDWLKKNGATIRP